MPKGFRERTEAKIEKYLAELTADAEAFALFGAGYPTSVYKVYVRASPKAKWWKFDHSVSPNVPDPMKYQARVKMKARAAALWSPIALLNEYQHHPDKPAVVRLMATVKNLSPR
ncbi:MAG TPA: hypothetical protein VHF22_07710 [Planctomycetota bacterium]|nr:hypothetical protein [Planctomycetota bacterium]